MEVTFDLNIAKVALKIQNSHPYQLYKPLFIHLGMFHVMLAFFHAIGKFIANSGLTNVMVDSGIIADGSINGFLAGKHFNRCKRLHPLVALALRMILFRRFLHKNGIELSEQTIQYFVGFRKKTYENPKIEDDVIKKLINDYDAFEQGAYEGKLGKTCQFYGIYLRLVDYYLLLERSLRTANFDLFLHILPKINAIFFVCNQQNYSRWLAKYIDNLLKVDETHPGLKDKHFKTGSFSARRTKFSYSREPIDKILEETINADAGSPSGVTYLKQSRAALIKWTLSRGTVAELNSHTLDCFGIKKKQDCSAELKEYRIKLNRSQLEKLIQQFDHALNPFSSDTNASFLYNIYTGKSCKTETADFLLNFEKIGNKERDKFIKECSEEATRFDKRITRVKMLTFQSELPKRKIKINGKEKLIKFQRDFFGRL